MFAFDVALLISSFVAGFLMFLAPCTLPLVPAFLAFISGVKPGDVNTISHRRKIVINSLYYVLGFSVVFISLGALAGFAGVLVASLKQVLLPVTGIFIIFFALLLLGVIHIGKLERNYQVAMPKFVHPGEPLSAFVIGVAFALGWSPCVGPIMATILLLAGTTETVVSGVLMLSVFSLGLAIPFVLTAVLYGSATKFIAEHAAYARFVQYIGGGFLLIIGLLLLTNNFELTILYGTKLMEFFGLGNLLDYY